SLDRAHHLPRVRDADHPGAGGSELELVSGQLEGGDSLRRDPAPALEGEPRPESRVVRVAAAREVDAGRGWSFDQPSRLVDQLPRPSLQPGRLLPDSGEHVLPAKLDALPDPHQASAFAAFDRTYSSAVTGS